MTWQSRLYNLSDKIPKNLPLLVVPLHMASFSGTKRLFPSKYVVDEIHSSEWSHGWLFRIAVGATWLSWACTGLLFAMINLCTGLACLEENKAFPWKFKSELTIRSLPTQLARTDILLVSLYLWPLFSIWVTTSRICLTRLLSKGSFSTCLYASILFFLSKSAALLSPSKFESLWYSHLWYL